MRHRYNNLLSSISLSAPRVDPLIASSPFVSSYVLIPPRIHISIHPYVTYPSMHPYTRTSVHPYIHIYIHPYVNTSTHPYIHTSIGQYVHPYIHSHTCTWTTHVPAFINTVVSVCCLAVWLSGCLSVWLSGCLAVWLCGCLPVSTQAYADKDTDMWTLDQQVQKHRHTHKDF